MEWVTTENTYDETWRRLLEFANIEFAIDAIERIHGKATSSAMKKNYKKQAEQVRVSLLQAKEYFEASNNSSLITQPNHLYYGSIALTTACMLILGDGSKSLDFLRQDNKNAHHGLNFTFSATLENSKKGVHLLENAYIEICKNGHFSNWYKCLKPIQNNYGTLEKINKNKTVLSEYTLTGYYEIKPFNELEGKKFTLFELLGNLPDLQSDLRRFDLEQNGIRGSHNIIYDLSTDSEKHSFSFHPCINKEFFDSILSEFKYDDKIKPNIIKSDCKTSGIISFENINESIHYPDSRISLDNSSYFFNNSIYTPEVVDLFVISYALSMLSRYFPDIWVSFIESHGKGSKIVERLVQLFSLKLPLLILNQMSKEDIVITNHKPHW